MDSKKGVVGGVAASFAAAGAASAQGALDLRDRLTGADVVVVEPDIAAAGNGGTATASADGGSVSVGDVNSGLNSGSSIGVGDVHDGAVAVEGGDVSNATSLGISADGGVAIADASGGDDNFAFVS